MIVYIPTKGRVEMVQRVLLRWTEFKDAHIVLAVEPQEFNDYRYLKRLFDIGLLKLGSNNQGIGYSRQSIIHSAARHEHESIIMANDDMIPSGDMEKLWKLAQRRDVIGIGAWMRIYNLYMRGTRAERSAQRGKPGLFLHSGSIGYQLFAVNVKNVLAAGNYDRRMSYGEDAEVTRLAMRDLGLPWMVFTGAFAQPLQNATVTVHRKGQVIKGGLVALGSKAEHAHASHRITVKRWPEHCKLPPKGELRIRFQWRRLMDQTIDIESWPPENIQTVKPYDWRGR